MCSASACWLLRCSGMESPAPCEVSHAVLMAQTAAAPSVVLGHTQKHISSFSLFCFPCASTCKLSFSPVSLHLGQSLALHVSRLASHSPCVQVSQARVLTCPAYHAPMQSPGYNAALGCIVLSIRRTGAGAASPVAEHTSALCVAIYI